MVVEGPHHFPNMPPTNDNFKTRIFLLLFPHYQVLRRILT